MASSFRRIALTACALACAAMVCFTYAAKADTGDPLVYYGGPVSHSMRAVIVDWGAHVRSTYTSGDPAFFSYLASQSGSPADVAGVLAQYMDTSGQNSANRMTYGGQFTIAPPVGATPPATVHDSDLQSALSANIANHTLPAPNGDGLSTVYVVLLPPGDELCDGSNTCATANFCAYHGSVPGSSPHILYAAMVDNGPNSPNNGGCGTSSTDLNNQTSVTSHEWAETINDPLVAESNTNGPPLAWYDNVCNQIDPTQCNNGEIGDKCNTQQGTNGPWTVQFEWSNLDHNCVGSEASFATPTASFTAAANPVASQATTFDGSSSSDPPQNHTAATDASTGNSYSIASGLAGYDWNWGDGTAHGTGQAPSHVYAAAGTYQVSLTVTDSLGFTSTVTKSVAVGNPPPAATTGGTSGVTDQTAMLDGTINPYNATVTYKFVYGLSPAALTQSTPVVPGPTGSSATAVSAEILELTASTRYYYRLDVIAGAVTYSGHVRSFATSPGPAPPQTPPPPQIPTAGTGGATATGTSSAQLNATINPGGPTAVLYLFAYGTSPAAPDHATSLQSEPGGSAAVPVHAAITGLSPHTTYYFRLYVSLNGQVYPGGLGQFTTAATVPTVSTGGVTQLGARVATVHGTVNPNGLATAYLFEFGTSTRYGHSSVLALAGAGPAPVTVTATLDGLRPRTVYHYRIVAASAGGIVPGPDRTFTTPPPPPPPPRFSFSVIPGQRLGHVLAHGLRVAFSCSAACSAHFNAFALLAGLTRSVATAVSLAGGTGHLRARGTAVVALAFRPSAARSLSNDSALPLRISGFAAGTGGSTTAPRSATRILKR